MVRESTRMEMVPSGTCGSTDSSAVGNNSESGATPTVQTGTEHPLVEDNVPTVSSPSVIQEDDKAMESDCRQSNESGELKDHGDDTLSKEQVTKLPRSQRKRRRYEEMVAKRKELRHAKKEMKKAKRAAAADDRSSEEVSSHVNRRDLRQVQRSRCEAAMKDGYRVCVDLSLEDKMSGKEHSKLAQQLARLYGANKKSEQPMHVYFTGIDKTGHLYAECVRKNDGFERYLVDMHEEMHTEIFKQDEIVYLSPDSPNILQSVEKGKVYIIGGLVDETRHKNISLDEAGRDKVATACLPIDKYMEKSKQGTFCKVLAINQVFEILLEFSISGDWKKALVAGVPPRTGYLIRPEVPNS